MITVVFGHYCSKTQIAILRDLTLVNYTVFWVVIVYSSLSFPSLFLSFCHYPRFCLQDIVSNQPPCRISVASGVR